MKTAVSVTLGALLLVAGIALLVLPGPGFVLIAAGLALLATRFDWAKKPLDYAKDKAQQGIDEVKDSKVKAGLALACALALVVLGILGVAGVKLPFLNTLSAIVLILSGLFLVGTVIYARMQRNQAPRSLI
ncbi:PGPGW domain-containing protein [Nakamurella deserti]|uniref:PGPGW domain-containing protein n=1 Tax=Nakamurella deserti TaxID=2164074 RepID=UPI000DBE7CD9|nr:PGPGW domain-containing protein [Nakamurella deserti]